MIKSNPKRTSVTSVKLQTLESPFDYHEAENITPIVSATASSTLLGSPAESVLSPVAKGTPPPVTLVTSSPVESPSDGSIYPDHLQNSGLEAENVELKRRIVQLATQRDQIPPSRTHTPERPAIAQYSTKLRPLPVRTLIVVRPENWWPALKPRWKCTRLNYNVSEPKQLRKRLLSKRHKIRGLVVKRKFSIVYIDGDARHLAGLVQQRVDLSTRVSSTCSPGAELLTVTAGRPPPPSVDQSEWHLQSGGRATDCHCGQTTTAQPGAELLNVTAGRPPPPSVDQSEWHLQSGGRVTDSHCGQTTTAHPGAELLTLTVVRPPPLSVDQSEWHLQAGGRATDCHYVLTRVSGTCRPGNELLTVTAVTPPPPSVDQSEWQLQVGAKLLTVTVGRPPPPGKDTEWLLMSTCLHRLRQMHCIMYVSTEKLICTRLTATWKWVELAMNETKRMQKLCCKVVFGGYLASCNNMEQAEHEHPYQLKKCNDIKFILEIHISRKPRVLLVKGRFIDCVVQRRDDKGISTKQVAGNAD
ncbi:hypothetical protein J6590_092533 [Homalodisca vitripennis]|nr:hypothetical protein J6590_092533 [Homalodisca vitripennis]